MEFNREQFVDAAVKADVGAVLRREKGLALTCLRTAKALLVMSALCIATILVLILFQVIHNPSSLWPIGLFWIFLTCTAVVLYRATKPIVAADMSIQTQTGSTVEIMTAEIMTALVRSGFDVRNSAELPKHLIVGRSLTYLKTSDLSRFGVDPAALAQELRTSGLVVHWTVENEPAA